MIGILADDVDHVIDGDAPQQNPGFTDDRGGDEVPVLEQTGHLDIRQISRNTMDVAFHDGCNQAVGVVGEQRGQRQHAAVLAGAIDNEQ